MSRLHTWLNFGPEGALLMRPIPLPIALSSPWARKGIFSQLCIKFLCHICTGRLAPAALCALARALFIRELTSLILSARPEQLLVVSVLARCMECSSAPCCCTTCVNLCAKSCLPAWLSGEYLPSANMMLFPTVNAIAFRLDDRRAACKPV